MGNILILSGNSGSGKTTIMNELLQTGEYRQLVTVTTRPQRTGEQHGKDYYFIDKEQYHQLAQGGRKGLLPETTEYSGVGYGIYRKDLDAILFSDKTTICIADKHGKEWLTEWFSHDNLMKLVRDSHDKAFLGAVLDFIAENRQVTSVFVGISLEEMERRLVERGSKPEEIERRLTQAKNKELKPDYRHGYDFELWNERISLANAVELVKDVFPAVKGNTHSSLYTEAMRSIEKPRILVPKQDEHSR